MFLVLPKVTFPLALTERTPEVSIGVEDSEPPLPPCDEPPLFPLLEASTNSSILFTTEFHSWASRVSPVFLA